MPRREPSRHIFQVALEQQGESKTEQMAAQRPVMQLPTHRAGALVVRSTRQFFCSFGIVIILSKINLPRASEVFFFLSLGTRL